jgi:Xaa-Pro aminopeptidase
MPDASPHERLATELREREVDFALLASPGNVCYASGVEVFLPVDAGTEFAGGPTLAVASADGAVKVLVPEAHAALAASLVNGAELISVPGFGHFDSRDPEAEFIDAVRRALVEVGGGRPQRVGYEPRWLPAGVVSMVEREFPQLELVSADPALLAARAVKAGWELERIRGAVAVADAAQARLLDTARAGVNELELWGEVTAAAYEQAGHSVVIVGEIVSGPRTGVLRYPGGPFDRVLQAGDTVLMDFSVRVDGYWADCCNTLTVDAEPTADQLRCYRASRAAIDAAVAALKPGSVVSAVDEAARLALADYGFEPVHYTGHQIGVVVNEPPRAVRYDNSEVRAGMVFAIEPGAYAGEQIGTGSRSEKVVLVTGGDAELISEFTWGMDHFLT